MQSRIESYEFNADYITFRNLVLMNSHYLNEILATGRKPSKIHNRLRSKLVKNGIIRIELGNSNTRYYVTDQAKEVLETE